MAHLQLSTQSDTVHGKVTPVKMDSLLCASDNSTISATIYTQCLKGLLLTWISGALFNRFHFVCVSNIVCLFHTCFLSAYGILNTFWFPIYLHNSIIMVIKRAHTLFRCLNIYICNVYIGAKKSNVVNGLNAIVKSGSTMCVGCYEFVEQLKSSTA